MHKIEWQNFKSVLRENDKENDAFFTYIEKCVVNEFPPLIFEEDRYQSIVEDAEKSFFREFAESFPEIRYKKLMPQYYQRIHYPYENDEMEYKTRFLHRYKELNPQKTDESILQIWKCTGFFYFTMPGSSTENDTPEEAAESLSQFSRL